MHASLLRTDSLPLAGRHLIEASAGTGKTYNITRLYLRLLLERQFSVQQILVMTFTKAATEELRGRIAATLREAHAHLLEDRVEDDSLHAALRIISKQQAVRLLEAALLEMDDASIFTIHGFCGRVVKEQAFRSAMAMDLTLETDLYDLRLDAVRDWVRQTAQTPEDYALLVENNWHQPHEFYRAFQRALTSSTPVEAIDSDSLRLQFEQLEQEFTGQLNQLKQRTSQVLLDAQALVFEKLIDGHKQEAQRKDEWQVLLAYLEEPCIAPLPKPANDFINGNRYRNKEDIKTLLAPIKAIKEQVSDWQNKTCVSFEKRLAAAPAYQLAAKGIDSIRARIAEQKQRIAVLDFDDMISAVYAQLHRSDADDLIDAMRERYPVALVDEFQDTDASQYGIVNTVYPKAHERLGLFMIGDPKQAIYGFRGGDIFAYLAARQEADYHWMMDTNWRSTKDVVLGYNRLFWGSPLDQSPSEVFGYGIEYEQMHSTDKAKAASHPLQDPDPDVRALTYVLAELADDVKVPANNKQVWRDALTAWFGAEITRLLSEVRIGTKLIQPGDIAMLVRTRQEAQIIQNALADVGLASVFLSSKHPLYASEQARELLLMLTGIWECERDQPLIAALSTSLMGGSVAKLIDLRQSDSDSQWEQERERALMLRSMWEQHGCMAVILHVMQHYYQPLPEQRERALTNTLHLAELLQKAARHYRHPIQLLAHLKQQIEYPQEIEEAEQRLESDMALIKIITQHGSKGLEYPIVFVPFATDYSDPVKIGPRLSDTFYYHPQQDAVACFQLGASEQALRLSREEGHAEALRLLYVAVTRASHRCYLGIAPFADSGKSAMAKAVNYAEHGDWHAAIATLVDSSHGAAALIRTSARSDSLAHHIDTIGQHEPTKVASFTGHIDASWRLTSFSALARQAELIRQDRKEHGDDSTAKSNAPRPPLLPIRFSLKRGADAGNLLHDTLEHTDFSRPNWEQSVIAPLQRFGQLDDSEHQALIDWLDDTLHAPLPGLSGAGELCLAQLHWPQTLREAEFYFPIEQLDEQALFACLAEHRGQPDSIELRLRADIKGMMHGFIDLIFEHEGRYFVADYKSTWLGDHMDAYHADALEQNNQSHLYDLQYLIYAVALHRYLSARLPDYSPAHHFGGVYYLYLRGMSAANKDHQGVYSCTVPTDLLLRLDACFGADINEGAA